MDEFGINSGYVAELLDRYLRSPESVDEPWRDYLRARLNGQPVPSPAPVTASLVNGNGTTNGHAPVEISERPSQTAMSFAEVQGKVSQLINAYRARGHLFARVDPLRL